MHFFVANSVCYSVPERPNSCHIQKKKGQTVAANFRDIDRMGSVFMTLL